MNLLEKCLVPILFISFTLAAPAEFRTPDTGTTYTLATLSGTAPGCLEQTGEGFILKEKLIISGSDTLVARDDFLLIDPIDRELTTIPILVIEGRLIAENLVVRTNGEGVEGFFWGSGFLITGLGHQGMAEASITSCTFQTLRLGVRVRAGAKAVIERSRFQDCYYCGIRVYMQGEGHILESTFQNAHAFFINSRGSFQNCDFMDSNVALYDLNNEVRIKGCHIEGVKDNGVFIYNGSGAKIEDTTIAGFHYGIGLAGNASPTLLRNTIKDNLEGGMVAGDNTAPVLRGNRITGNAVNPPNTNGPIILPAILIQDNAAPDMGTSVTLGRNMIQGNGPLALYHAGMRRIFAQGNDWGTDSVEEAENLIYHKVDDNEDADKSGFLSGVVMFAPLLEPFKGNLFLLF